ncbi:MAG: polysulfide reductase NrfD [Desulfomonile tiedjei]|uniref:Polysulfide reductase NrfD n=1 Tax=Desulfomonile tiedjei TaxID=2358 RepID=A0A9D6UZV8_9BACT|nr:polysulfide reductase NrfD [Desulfomonile tiedjei]
MPESAWGWLIVAYLFLAGAGSGAFLAAVACDLLAPDWSRTLARAGSLAAGPLVTIGTVCLVLDLEAGLWQPWRQIYLVSNLSSMITWGVIILSAFIPVAFLYAAALNEITFVGRFAKKYLLHLEIVGSVLAASTAAYTGVLIAVVNGVPFWNTPLMPVLFMASAISTGLAVAMIGAAILDINTIKTLSNFALGHLIFLSVEAVVLMMFIFMSLTRSVEAAASADMLISGVLSPYFWVIVVVLGIVLPFLLSIVEYYKYGELHKYLVIGADLCVLLGGMSLRAVIIFSATPPQVI